MLDLEARQRVHSGQPFRHFSLASGPAGHHYTYHRGALFLQRIGAEGVVHIPYSRAVRKPWSI